MTLPDFDEIPPIVLDCGSYTCQVGYAGDDAPSAVFPTVIGKVRNLQPMIGLKEKQYYIGDEAQAKRGILSLKYPIKRGVVTDWDLMQRIWHHAFYTELRTDPSKHPIIVTEVPLNPKVNRSKTMELIFEVFKAPATYICIPAVLAFYSSGRGAGLILESGDGVTHVVPIYFGYTIPHAILRMNIGGRDVTDYLNRLLNQRGYTFNTSAEKEVVRSIKEESCFVSSDFEAELKNNECFNSIISFELPDGNKINFGDESFIAPELLFQPRLIGREDKGIVEFIFESLMRCPIDIRRDFYYSIILTGGNTMFKGFADRVSKDLEALLPNNIYAKTVAPPERKYSTWIGGSIIASLSTFEYYWILRDEYDELGPDLLEEKCL
eukprot:snap_masked-scaffold_2-processed-gene-20.13-mRNA-1 protein AED:0.03 eAED:0.03 QI:0/-1/0/1/-1/1/1/0/378